jgi:hypothetical protein
MAQIQEPPSAYNGKYPYNQTSVSESGHVTMVDDTPGSEIMRWQHKAGTFTEWQPDGTEVHHIVGKGYYITESDGNVLINGACNINIVGQASLTFQNDVTVNYQGNVNEVAEKDYSLLVKGEYTVSSSGNLNLNAMGQLSGIYVQAGDRMILNTDLSVSGQVLADDIHSQGGVTAGTGIHAGIPGSVNPVAGISTLGGVNVGIPGPTVPGTVTATVLVTAPAIIGSVITYGAILMDPEGGAPLIRAIYDSHTHIDSKGGLTTPPLAPMP